MADEAPRDDRPPSDDEPVGEETEEERRARKAAKKAKRRAAKEKRNIIVSDDTSRPFGHFKSTGPSTTAYQTEEDPYAVVEAAATATSYEHYEQYRFYEVTVDDPQKVGDGMGSYTTYNVYVKSTDDEFKPDFNCRARYSQFEKLRQALVEAKPNLIVPEMPPKQFFGRFAPDFVGRRAEGLTVFMNSICSHAVFGKQEALINFFRDNRYE